MQPREQRLLSAYAVSKKGQAVVDSILKSVGEAYYHFMDIADTDSINKLFEDTAEKYG